MLADLVFRLPAVLIAVTIHEYAHAYAALRLGDPTAKLAGRLTLNPLRHIDPLGFIALLIARIGWAKPVPIIPSYFRNPRWGMALVSLAGPLANLILAVFVGLLLRVLLKHALQPSMLASGLVMIYIFNVILCAFNLLPVPPLDGSKILFALLPEGLRSYQPSFERFGPLVIFGLIVLDMGTGANVLWGYVSAVSRLINSLVIGMDLGM